MSESPIALHPPLCDLLGCDWPVLASCRIGQIAALGDAGGCGLLRVTDEPPAQIADAIRQIRERTARPFGIDFTVATDNPRLCAEQIASCINAVVPLALLGQHQHRWVGPLAEAGIRVGCEIRDAGEVPAAVNAGATVIIATADGPRTALANLAATATVPVIIAEASAGDSGLAAALAVGAQGIYRDSTVDDCDAARWLQRVIAATRRQLAADDISVAPAQADPVAASPPCAAGDVDPAYLGFASHEELRDSLRDLLQHERADAGLAAVALCGATDRHLRTQLQHAHRDCVGAMQILSACLRSIGTVPEPVRAPSTAPVTGDRRQQLARLARHRQRQLDRLQALLPTVADPVLYQTLARLTGIGSATLAAASSEQ